VVSVGFVSLGCSKNVVDAQVMAGFLLDDGLVLAPAPEAADVVIVNTCAFIGDAREEAAEAILQVCRLKTAGGCRGVVVTGCLAQRYGERLFGSFPEIDACVGVDALDRIGAIIRRVAAGERGIVAVTAKPSRLFNPTRPALSFSGGPFAWLKIAEGCSHACAFCAIPGIRGALRSRPLDEVVAEARALLAAGARELNIIAQDTTAYGRDRREREGLAALLRALDTLDGRFWLRVMYGYPSLISDALLETVAASRHVCRYFDVPIQHSHPDILRAMRRADTIQPVAALSARIRGVVPGAAVRTTCLVGFPGEDDVHFEHLLASVAQARFDHLGVFVYSPEEGTVACRMGAVPPPEVAEERRERLMLAQRRIVDEKRRELAGTSADALLIRPARPLRGRPAWEARIERQAPDVDGVTRVVGVPADARPGDWARVTLTGGRSYDLYATAEPEVPASDDACSHPQ
jgi:ribosomal protein S12 methylthiotransferase